MNKRWKKVMFISLVLLMSLGWIIYTRVPVKYAVKIDKISNYKNCILVKEAWHTGTGWEMEGDASGFFTQEEKINDVYLTGKELPLTDAGGDNANTFLCIVKYTGKKIFFGEEYDGYEIKEWYPVYPVKRDTILPSWIYPKGYFSYCDHIEKYTSYNQ